mgnify:FL=1
MKNETLRKLMFDHDINQTQLALKTGVPQPTINRFLHGQSKSPNFGSVKKLAEYFDVSVHSLFEGSSPQ